ncbi:hypothetical protein OAT72_00775 [Alphaproteobacteria bacterium]|nr:hypothetical protein [Alphaproteobacteria bacterium]
MEVYNLPLNFEAISVTEDGGDIQVKVSKTSIANMCDDEIVVEVHYSSINFKDKLICAGNKGLVRKFPHIPGIDAVGKVVISCAEKHKVGESVIIIATPLGVSSPGGLAKFIKIPSSWALTLPEHISLKMAASFGTAGYTAALCIHKLEQHESFKNQFPILVTGGSGGVGLISTLMLSERGHNVEAVTTNKHLTQFHQNRKNVSVVRFDEFTKKNSFPLLKVKYAGAIETLGGESLSVASRSITHSGTICVLGNAHSASTTISLMPFFQRSINMVGINAESNDPSTRDMIWELISRSSISKKTTNFIQECTLHEAVSVLVGKTKTTDVGRILVNVLA